MQAKGFVKTTSDNKVLPTGVYVTSIASSRDDAFDKTKEVAAATGHTFSILLIETDHSFKYLNLEDA